MTLESCSSCDYDSLEKKADETQNVISVTALLWQLLHYADLCNGLPRSRVNCMAAVIITEIKGFILAVSVPNEQRK